MMWPPKKNTLRCSQQKKKATHHEEIELNFDASRQQIIGLDSEILWEAGSTPTFGRARTGTHARASPSSLEMLCAGRVDLTN
jgi:hypothetical protein